MGGKQNFQGMVRLGFAEAVALILEEMAPNHIPLNAKFLFPFVFIASHLTLKQGLH